jgi:hypothetical protein
LPSIVIAACVLCGACNGEIRFDDVTSIDASADASNPADAAPPEAAPPEAALPEAAAPEAAAPEAAPHVGCTVDKDCPLAALHCDAVSGECVACVVDSQCTSSGGKRCDVALHRCVECGVDGDCGANAKCELQSRRCVHTCQSFSDCVPTAPLCDMARGYCILCRTEVECRIFGNLRVCDVAAGQCVQCVSDADCTAPAAKRCDRAVGRCVSCLASSDCAASAACDPATGACVP